MDNLEEKLNSLLQDPDTMSKIMAMAQSLGGGEKKEQKEQKEQREQPKNQQGLALPDVDLGMLQKISGMTGQGSIDQNQRALLKALSPYLSRQRIHKLENAMRAAKMAQVASVMLSRQGAKNPMGR